jgi:hypothetical protein
MRARWRVHICTTTPDQAPFDAVLRAWLRRQGHVTLTDAGAARSARIAAARACDLCILLLGPSFGPCDPFSSFSDTELEAAAAADVHFGKLLVFAQSDVDRATSPEQREFLDRQRGFVGGTFQATARTPEELVAQVAAALRTWRPPSARGSNDPLQVPERAVMISSTGDLVAERDAVGAVLAERRTPAIDYLRAASEPVPPLDRVISWARDCRALALILGSRYGYVSPADGLGVTELEFVTALAAGRPILAFLRHDAETTPDVDQRQFVARVRHFVPAARIFAFASPAELQTQLRAALAALERERRPAVRPAIAPIPDELARAWYRRQIARWLGTVAHPAAPRGKPLDQMPLLLARVADLPSNAVQAAPGLDRWDVAASFTVDEALAGNPRLVIEGAPGSGKSVTLQWYALRAVEGAEPFAAPVAPIFMRLADYARERRAGRAASLLDALQAEERRLMLAPDARRSLWREELLAGRGVVLLDGLDAVPLAEQEKVAADIHRLADELPRATPIVVSTRAEGLGQSVSALFPAPFVVLDMRPLTSGQQQDLARSWLESLHRDDVRGKGQTPTSSDETGGGLDQPDRAEAAQKALQQRMTDLLLRLDSDPLIAGLLGSRFDVHAQLTSWARSPLLLTLFAAVTDTPGAIDAPLTATNAQVFHRSLRLLLAQRDERAGGRCWLDAKDRLLLALARRIVLEGGGETFTAAEVAQLRTQARSQSRGETTDNIHDATADELLQGLSAGVGLLVREGVDRYRFLHPTFAAYLAARLVAALPEGKRLDLVRRRRLYVPWQDVTELTVAELDRLGRHAEADRVVRTLLAADGAPVAGSPYTDLMHLSLRRAARAQGGRPWEEAARDPGPEIAAAWAAIWHGEDRYGLREDAMRALAALGPAAADTLPELIESRRGNQGSMFSAVALRALARHGNAEARAFLVRQRAEDEAAPTGPQLPFDASLEVLRQRLHDGDVNTRRHAAVTLQKYGRAATSIIDDLAEALQDPDQFVRLRVVEVLAHLGPLAGPALGPLTQVALTDYNAFLINSINIVFQHLGPLAAPAVPELAVALSDPDRVKRATAASLLRDIGPAALPAKDALLAALLDEEFGIAPKVAAEALLGLGPNAAAEALAVVRGALHDEDPNRQRAAIYALGYLGPEVARPAIPELCALAREANNPNRSTSLQVLGNLGPAAAEAVPVLRTLVGETVGITAIEALGKIGAAAAPTVNDLRRVLRDAKESGSARAAALTALGRINQAAGGEVLTQPDLVAALKDESRSVQMAAMQAARHVPALSPAFIAEFLALAHRDDDWSRTMLWFDLAALLPRIEDADSPAEPAPQAPETERPSHRL